jgi:hypothetical protein
MSMLHLFLYILGIQLAVTSTGFALTERWLPTKSKPTSSEPACKMKAVHRKN